jgi:hypothetical protein
LVRALVPAPVESRVRKKLSKRARRIGLAVIGGYVLISIAGIFLFRGSHSFLFLWLTGIGVGVRYLRTANLLEKEDAVAPDDATANLLNEYESKVRAEAQREVAGGTLSLPAAESKGELSLARESGRLSIQEGDE